MHTWFQGLGLPTEIMISTALMLLVGFLVTRLTKLLRLPNVTGFILAGVLLGPWVLDAIPEELISGMGFLSDLALAFIAFGVGKFFKLEALRATGGRVLFITLLEALLAGALVTLVMYLGFGLNIQLSLLLGAIATATAPASTVMTIKQYGAKGRFVDLLLQIVALDDVVCLLVFGVASAVVGAGDKSLSLGGALLPLAYNLAAIALGALCALLLCLLMKNPTRSRDNRIILPAAMLLAIAGICSAFDTSPLLACMTFGALYVNLTEDDELFSQVDGFTPPILSAFFVLSGMRLDVRALGSFGLVGVGYFLLRIVGKYLGSFVGCSLAREDKRTRYWLGLGLMPQAGVAIGLAFLGERILPPAAGNLLLNVILASSVLYELLGPACAKLALIRAGTIESRKK